MTVEFDIFAAKLRADLDRIVEIKAVSDYVRVTTHCMYPSNGLVSVAVRAGNQTARVSDEGGACSEALSAGILTRQSDKTLTRLIADQGLAIKDGAIVSPPVPLDALGVAILLVANASRQVADWLYANARIKPVRDFNKALVAVLERTFRDNLRHDESIAGERRAHKFANVVQIDFNKRLVVDSVKNESSSIATRVISHLDVKRAANPDVVQRIVYDDEEAWRPDDLAMLGMAEIPIIAFSRSSELLLRAANVR